MGTGTSFSIGRTGSMLSPTRQLVLTFPLTVADRNTGNGAIEQHWCHKGSYIVNRSLGKGIYEIQSEGGKVLKQEVNIGRIKVYRKRDLVDQNKKKTT